MSGAEGENASERDKAYQRNQRMSVLFRWAATSSTEIKEPARAHGRHIWPLSPRFLRESTDGKNCARCNLSSPLRQAVAWLPFGVRAVERGELGTS